MSDSDSFIEEVSDEVRRDRLFRLFRKYGWIPILVVVLIVAGAAYNEWTKAEARAAAEARGSAILAALAPEAPEARAAALAALEAEVDGRSVAVVALLEAAEKVAAEDPAAAAAALERLAGDADLPQVYRQLAVLKRAMLLAAEIPPEARIAQLTPLTTPGAPYRVLAEEQIALAEAEMGDTDAAVARLRALAQDTESSRALRQRASRLIVALGGSPDGAS